MRRLITIISTIVLLSLCSCNKNGGTVPEEFLSETMPCLMVKGKIVLQSNPDNWQFGYNESKKQFRVHNDTMSEYYVLDCKSAPQSLGQEIQANIKWSGSYIYNISNLTFRVEKINADGLICLWCKSEKIAVGVKILQ